jgi:hypothetical protein
MSADGVFGLPLAQAIAWLLALAVLLASARMLWRWRSPGAPTRPQAWRAVFLLVAQAGSAALLYFTVFPPSRPTAAGTLTVLTARAADAAATLEDATPRGLVIALPEAAPVGARWIGAERVPDLATALRRYPAMRTVHVVGAGLVPRDRPAARTLDLRFHPAPLPRGIAELALPQDVAAGRAFRIGGRVQGMASGQVELLDPARRRVARSDLSEGGGFDLHASTRTPGLAIFTLRVRDAGGRVLETASVPLQVSPARRLRALALAGAPEAELKFLRRWALDAGIDLDTRIELGAGLRIASARTALDAASLDRLDLLLVDERSWRGLGAGQRATVLGAVDSGLGLLLRVSAGATAGDRAALRALGFSANATPVREVRLGAGFVRAGDAVDALPPILRSPLQPVAADGVVALADAAGTPLATWRARGRGRVGVAGFDDTWRLVLAGRSDAHGEVWSRLATVLARAQPREPAPQIEAAPPGERTVLCAVPAGAVVVGPDGAQTALLADPRTGARACAGFWAKQPGWHALRAGEREWPFHLPMPTQWPAKQALALRDATLALAGEARATPSAATVRRPGPRWPWFAGWLLLTAALWWLERSRQGLVPAGR